MNASLYQAFFGNSKIKERVIISPIFYPKVLAPLLGSAPQETRTLQNYTIANFIYKGKNTSFIKVSIGPSHTGELTIMLKDTPCRQVILLGTIGGINKGMQIGDLFVADSAADGEGFSAWLKKNKPKEIYRPSLKLSKKIKARFPNAHTGRLLTIGSILEETPAVLKGYDGVDMESSALFSAAKAANIAAAGIYVVSDLPLTRPFYTIPKEEQYKILSELNKLLTIIIEL